MSLSYPVHAPTSNPPARRPLLPSLLLLIAFGGFAGAAYGGYGRNYAWQDRPVLPVKAANSEAVWSDATQDKLVQAKEVCAKKLETAQSKLTDVQLKISNTTPFNLEYLSQRISQNQTSRGMMLKMNSDLQAAARLFSADLIDRETPRIRTAKCSKFVEVIIGKDYLTGRDRPEEVRNLAEKMRPLLDPASQLTDGQAKAAWTQGNRA